MPPSKGWGAGYGSNKNIANAGTQKAMGTWAAKIAATGSWDILSSGGTPNTQMSAVTCDTIKPAKESDTAKQNGGLDMVKSALPSNSHDSSMTQDPLKPTEARDTTIPSSAWDTVVPAPALDNSKPTKPQNSATPAPAWDTITPTPNWDMTPAPAWNILKPTESKESAAPVPAWDTMKSTENCPEKKPATTWEWVDLTPPKTEEELAKEKIDKELEGWPWTGTPSKLATLGPNLLNLFPDHLNSMPNMPLAKAPLTQDDCPLLAQLFQHQLVFQTVMKFVCQSHDSQWKFSATCRAAWYMLAPNTEHSTTDLWDITGGTFNNCEKGFVRDARGNLPFVKPVLIITPVRKAGEPAGYGLQVRNLFRMCVAINNFSTYLKNIQFHRVPFLSVDLLALLIPSIPNLKHLGVYKCQLIHFGETIPLLETIKVDRPPGRENRVTLDFYPNYHRGPVLHELNAGPYGVTWDNWNGPTLLGIWCLVSSIIRRARAQGIDMVSKGTMFRKWLDDGPCWRVKETIKALEDPTYDKTALAALLDCNNGQHHGSVRLYTGNVGNRPEGWKWSVNNYRCAYCKEERLGMFFWYGYVRQARRPNLTFDPNHLSLKCYGCVLDGVLRGERDHYKGAKHCVIQNWLREESAAGPEDGPEDEFRQPQFNTTDLPRALADFEEKDVAYSAGCLQGRRNRHITEKGYDRETEEIQKPLTDREKNTKYGMRRRSPLVWDKLSDPKKRVYKNPGDIEWDYAPHSTSTMFAHGRW